jgi:D-glycerate 3-kinase
LTSQLPAHMSPHGIKTAVLSLDDLYLPHSGLVSLAAAHPDNVLLRGRGQPGTHDIFLGLRCMEALKRINDGEGSRVEMPIFDKSRFGGEGDRSEAVVQVTAGVDIVVLEGWMMGFAPLEEDELRSKYAAAASASRPEGADPPFFLAHALDHLEWSSMALREYGPLWTYFDCFVQMKPVEIGYTWQWRLQVSPTSALSIVGANI